MTRARLWAPLCEVDPVPGDPDQVTAAGRRYAAMAEEIAGQVRRLNGFVDGTLQGGYVQSLAKAAEGLKDDLGLTGRRYREVGGALQGWAPQLTGFQDEAERLRLVAVTAQGEMSDNLAVPQLRAVEAGPQPEAQLAAQVAAANARQGRYEDAGGDLSRAQGRLAELVGRRDAAAARVADAIRESCDDGVANSAWDSFQDWMDDHHELVSGICDVLGVIAIAVCVVALFVPGLNVAAAVALVALTSASLVGHSMLASTGHGSWGAVAVDVVNLATLGAASLAVRLFTEAGALVRGAAALKAAEEAAATTARATEEAAAIAAQKAAATATRNLDDLASLRGASVDDVRRLIPKGWIETPLKKGEGTRFLNPDRQGESIMIEKGWPGAKDPLHGGPYVRISRNGVVKRIPLDGNTVLGP